VLDHQNGKIRRQIGNRLLDARRIALRHAGGGLVEQQDPGFERKRKREFQQSLLAVGDLADAAAGKLGDAEPGKQRMHLIHHVRHGAVAGEHAAGPALALQDGERDMFLRRHLGEEPRHLEGPHEAAAHALRRPEAGDILVAERDRAGIRQEIAGDEVDEGRLAGAVRADQRNPVARCHR